MSSAVSTTQTANSVSVEPNRQAETLPPADAAPGQSGRVRLAFLDGLRGLAALYVLFYHLFSPKGLPAAVIHGMSWLHWGHYAVSIFIVLSGYSLMLPVTRSADGHLRGGVWNYLKRRALRILPPYYAALVLTIAFLLLAHRGTRALGIATDDSQYWINFAPGNLISHLLLLHSWNKDWIYTLDGPMWSVSIEWQIYFLFPLLLPLWRRFGLFAPIAAGLLLGVIPYLILPKDHNFDWACFWYTGLFAMGMAGAVICFSPRPDLRRWYERLPWGLLAAATFGMFFGITAFVAKGTYRYGIIALPQHWWVDALVGLGTTFLIIFCAKSAHAASLGSDSRLPLILRLFESRPAMRLGAFSYSLYLIHLPLVEKLYALVHRHFSPGKTTLIMLVVGLPMSLLAAYLFHLAFERPFMPEYRALREAKALALSLAARDSQ